MQYKVTIFKDDMTTRETREHSEIISAGNPRTALSKMLRLLSKREVYRSGLGKWGSNAGMIQMQYERITPMKLTMTVHADGISGQAVSADEVDNIPF